MGYCWNRLDEPVLMTGSKLCWLILTFIIDGQTLHMFVVILFFWKSSRWTTRVLHLAPDSRHGCPKALSKTTFANLDCVFGKTKLFSHWSLNVESRNVSDQKTKFSTTNPFFPDDCEERPCARARRHVQRHLPGHYQPTQQGSRTEGKRGPGMRLLKWGEPHTVNF